MTTDVLAWPLLLIAVPSIHVAYRFTRAAVEPPRVPFLSGSAFRETCSAIAAVCYAILGVNILTGRWMPSGIALSLFVLGVYIDRLPTIYREVQIRRWDREAIRQEAQRAGERLPG